MKIAIDGGVLSSESAVRGIGVYTKHLVEALHKITSGTKDTVTVIDAKNASDLSTYDVLHYPTFEFFFRTLPLKKKIRTIVTIHDTIPLIYPEHYPPGIRGTFALSMQKLALKSVSHIITDSETSKKDIVRFLSVDNRKITPVYLGPTVSDLGNYKNQSLVLREKYNLPESFAVYVGDVNWNKNLINLVEACALAKTHLVIVGKKAVSENYDKAHIENKPLLELQTKYKDNPYIHRVGYIPDNELSSLIKMSFCLCQLSFYEGFGLGVLDAMSLGVPTLCAKNQVFVELYENASLFVNPYDVREIANQIRKVKSDKDLRKHLSEVGFSKSKEFSWEKAAKETYEIYKKIAI